MVLLMLKDSISLFDWSLHFSKIPSRKEFGIDFNYHMIPLFRTFQYHSRNWMIECSKVFHIYFLCFWNCFNGIFHYSRDTFTFYSLIRKVLIIYRKINIRRNNLGRKSCAIYDSARGRQETTYRKS